MRKQLFLALLLLGPGLVRAADVSFEASVDRTTVGTGERFRLTFVLSNAGMGGGKNLQMPDLSDFYVLSGPNQSSSVQIINGSVSSSITYSYVLQPKDTGNFTIDRASVEVDGTRYLSSPVAVRVVQGSTTAAPPQNGQRGAGQSGTVSEDDLFLRAVVDRTRVLRGEQINLTYKLYTRVAIQNYGIEKNPTLTGFWSEEVESPKNVSLSTETINGKQYRVGVIRKLALFPTQSGTLEISPMEMKTIVQVQDRRLDPFDSFFRDPFGRSVEQTVRSAPIKVEVAPLPAGAPPTFKGAVGRFSMSADLNKTETPANEPVSLTVRISGTGNIKLLESPAVEFPTDFEQFTPKVTDKVDLSGGTVNGSKSFEYLLIPRYPGKKTIRPVAFSYYDLSRKKYVTLTSPAIDLNVVPGSATAPATPLAGPVREGVQVLSQDIRFIRSDPDLSPVGERMFSPLFAGLMALLPAVLAAAFVVVVRRQDAARRDVAGYRNRRAIGVARKRLKVAREMLGDTSNYVSFFAEIARALWSYLGDKLTVDQAEMSIDTVIARLEERSVTTETTSALRAILETCEMARFAPSGSGESDMQKAFDEAGSIIVAIENELRTR